MRIDPTKPLFPISTVSEILGCQQKVLRLYDRYGLVSPARSDGRRRLYSQRDVERLEFIHFLTHVKRVNIAGVKVILDLLDHLPQDKWESIIKSVEEEVESLPQEAKKVLEEGSPELVAQLEEEAE